MIDRFSGESESRVLGQAWGKLDANLAAELRANGDQTFHTLTPAEVARWQAAIEPVRTAWVKDTPDGARLLETLRTEYAAALAGR